MLAAWSMSSRCAGILHAMKCDPDMFCTRDANIEEVEISRQALRRSPRRGKAAKPPPPATHKTTHSRMHQMDVISTTHKYTRRHTPPKIRLQAWARGTARPRQPAGRGQTCHRRRHDDRLFSLFFKPVAHHEQTSSSEPLGRRPRVPLGPSKIGRHFAEPTCCGA